MNTKNKNILMKPHIVMILALLACLLWGSAFPSIKIGYDLFSIEASDTFGKLLFAGVRFLIAGIMLFIFSIVTGSSLKLNKESFYKVVILGLIQTTFQYIFFYIGVSNTSGTIGSILAATVTLFSAILAHFFYEEDRLNSRKILGIVLGFTGVIIVNISGTGLQGGFTFTGEGFIIISAFVGALGGIYTKRIAKDIPTFAITGYQLFFGSLILIVAGLLGGAEVLESTIQGYGLLLYLAFLSAAAFSIWTILLKYNSVGKVTIYRFTIPLFGILLSYIFLGERLLGPNVVTSLVLVSISIILINKEKAKIK